MSAFWFLSILLLPKLVVAQPADSSSSSKNREIIPFPVLYYTPETRWAFGAAAIVLFQTQRDSLTKTSQIFPGLAYTQNKQILFYGGFDVWWAANKHYLSGEAGFYKYNYYYYGTGNNRLPEEYFGVDFPRIRLNYYRQLHSNWYAGVRYWYEDYRTRDLVPAGGVEQAVGGQGNENHLPGLALFYDSRDRVIYPSSGLLLDGGFIGTSTQLGSSLSYTKWWVDLAMYRPIQKRIISASQLYLSGGKGDIPFQLLAFAGGESLFRGYYEGQFRDKAMLALQQEFRINVWRWVGLAVFGSLGWQGNQITNLRWQQPIYTMGAGLRLQISKKDKMNLRIDQAYGRSNRNTYFTFGEAF